MSIAEVADSQPEDNHVHQEITSRVISFLDGKGVPERGRVALIAEITGLSLVQARRRLTPQGPPWVVDELGALAEFYGEPLGSFLGLSGSASRSEAGQPCEIELAGVWYGARALIGKKVTPHSGSEIMAVRHETRWRLMPASCVPPKVVCHEVSGIQLLPKASQNIRVAVLDDDLSLAESLREALANADFSATAFASQEDLSSHLSEFDVFIIDFVLAPGKTASAIIEKIRAEKGQAPIIVLTGHARDAGNSEIAQLVRSFGVDVQEKPAEIILLISLIERRLGGGTFARQQAA